MAVVAGALDARVEQAVSAQEPAFVAHYAFELAQAFNAFYHKHHIRRKNAEKRAFLMALTAAVRGQLEGGGCSWGYTECERR